MRGAWIRVHRLRQQLNIHSYMSDGQNLLWNSVLQDLVREILSCVAFVTLSIFGECMIFLFFSKTHIYIYILIYIIYIYIIYLRI